MVRNYNRNDKEHQRQRMQNLGEAKQTLLGLQNLITRPGRIGITVGEMVNVAVSMGLLGESGSQCVSISSKKIS